MREQPRSKSWWAVVLVAAVGCGAPAEDGVAESTPVTETVVRLHGDAPPTVEIRTVAGPSTIAPGVAQVAQAIRRDGACEASSLYLNDAVNQTGNRICFFGAGQVNLASYCRATTTVCNPFGCRTVCAGTWAGAVRSYWAGDDSSGTLGLYTTPPGAGGRPTCTEFFLKRRRQDVALDCGRSANYVTLGNDFWGELFGRLVVVPGNDPNPPDVTLVIIRNRVSTTYEQVDPASTDYNLHGLTVAPDDVFDVFAYADNPGGVRDLGLNYSQAWWCRGPEVRRIESIPSTGGFASITSSDPAGHAGTVGLTRRALHLHADPGTASCRPGETFDGWREFSFSAYAHNYYGVFRHTAVVWYDPPR